MNVKITMYNPGGELESVVVAEEKAQEALVEMIEALGSINEGDTFTVRAE